MERLFLLKPCVALNACKYHDYVFFEFSFLELRQKYLDIFFQVWFFAPGY